jgi:hypothetical protein
VLVAGTLSGASGWQSQSMATPDGQPKELEHLPQTSYGTGGVRIDDVRFLDRDDRDIVEVRHGDPLTVRISIRVDESMQGEPVLFVLGFARHGSPYSALIYDQGMRLPRSSAAEITTTIQELRLGSGQWYVNVGIGQPGLYDKELVKYFTVDAGWHHVLATRLELRVASVSKFDASGCFVVHPAAVSVRTIESVPL